MNTKYEQDFYESDFDGLECYLEDYKLIFGRSAEEVLGYTPDEHSIENQILSDATLSDRGQIFEMPEKMLREIYEQESKKKRQEATKQRLLAQRANRAREKIEKEKKRIENLKNTIRDRIRDLHHEKQAREERKKQEKLKIQRYANLEILKHALFQNSQEFNLFFETCKYKLEFEEDKLFQSGDIGKLVVVYNSKEDQFRVIIGKQKSNDGKIPETVTDLLSLMHSDNMPHNAGMHREIKVPEDSMRFGGANFIFLEEKYIAIGSESGDFGAFPQEIVSRILSTYGYRTYFLGNRKDIPLSTVYQRVLELKERFKRQK